MCTPTLFLLSLFITYQPISHPDFQDSVSVGAGSSITVKGSSTLHDWDAVSANIQLSADLPEEWFQSQEVWNTGELTGIEAKVPVRSLESGRRKMNRDIQEALRMDQNPEIRFRSLNAVPLPDTEKNGPFEFELSGYLLLAGEEREVQFLCTINREEKQRLRTICETGIDMTEFNIHPPTAFFGVLKTDEMVSVVVDLVIALQ